MRKKYDLLNLYVITIKNDDNFSTKLICIGSRIFSFKDLFTSIKTNDNPFYTNLLSEEYQNIFFEEIFTGTKIDIDSDSVIKIEKLQDYYSPFISSYMLTKEELFSKYNDLNRIETLLNSTDEIIEKTLDKRGIFENSKVYKKRYSN